MQIVTTNQEQSVDAVRDTIENYLDSQKEVTNFVQSLWKSYIDNILWISTRRAIENYAATVSNTADVTVSGIGIYNNIIYAMQRQSVFPWSITETMQEKCQEYL